MSSDFNKQISQESGSNNKTENKNKSADNKPLTFKDWKSLKESQKKSNEKPQNKSFKPKFTNKSSYVEGKDNTNNYNNNDFNGSYPVTNFQEILQYSRNGQEGSCNNNNFNGVNNSTFGTRGNNFGSINNNFNNFNNSNNFNRSNNFNGNNFDTFNNNANSFNRSNNFDGNNFSNPNNSNRSNNFEGNNFNNPNNFNRSNNFNGNNFNNPNNFNTSNNFDGNNFNSRFNNSNGYNNFPMSNDVNNFGKSRNVDNLNLPDNFFASDGIYRQKDLMQKPLLDFNPFRNDQKADELLQEFDKLRYTKDYKNKKGKNKPAEVKKTYLSTDESKLSNEPEVYVRNPKARIEGKPYIQKPKEPEENYEITKEEKKQQWKEYRQAMKPFKNREFYNARRVVQRLGKESPNNLDFKQLIRLRKAREFMALYKVRLAAKYPNYVKTEDSSKELGELYVLKTTPLADSHISGSTIKQYQNDGNFGEGDSVNDIEAGSKLVEKHTGFKGFVAGGLLEDTI